jgi:hypothetical protein
MAAMQEDSCEQHETLLRGSLDRVSDGSFSHSGLLQSCMVIHIDIVANVVISEVELCGVRRAVRAYDLR